MWLSFLVANRKILIALAVISIAFIAGYRLGVKLSDLDELKNQLAIANATIERNQAIRERAEKLEDDLARLKKQSQKRNSEVRNEIKKNIYTTCIIPDDGLRLYRAAIAADYSG